MIPTLLATVQAGVQVSGPDALTAAIAGFEVGPRVGRALHGSQVLSRGWHSGPVFGTLAAATVTGTLCGLDALQMEDAFGMAATQSGGLMAAQYEAARGLERPRAWVHRRCLARRGRARLLPGLERIARRHFLPRRGKPYAAKPGRPHSSITPRADP